MAPDERAPARARRAVAGTFFLVGFGIATWFTEILRFSDRLASAPGTLAFALVAPTVGALASMQVVGPLTARIGSRIVVQVASVLLPVALLGVAFTDNIVQAIVMLVLFGAFDGALDVAANEQGVAVERALGRPVLNSLHGAWGAGAILGGAVSSGVIALDVSQRWHFALVAALLVPLGWFCGRRLLEVREPDRRTESPRGISSWLSGWTTGVLVLGAIGAAGMLAEGAVSNWIGVFLRDYKDAAAALAAAGYTVFTLTETLARYAGDRATERLGPVRLVWAACSLFAVGLLVILLSPGPWLAMAGLVLAGVGIAPINPLAFSAVGHSTADESASGTAIGHYTTLSYGGLLGGPAVIGAVAEWAGLPAALAFTLVAIAIIAVAAPALARTPSAVRRP
ncbi:MFS transporter [Actinoplanes sp. NPDC051343]|jgi:MFS family permease|uniref:MFS transporter n=1 Tax=Actinoplanes sp. NPDC051343 TaxID=3363906 RepID=UPI0037B8A267